ncbi:cytochrome P450 [Xylariaceae sp. AK1471]|nr:cytochrome P450 [Xylariaceae sp. AK1471]
MEVIYNLWFHPLKHFPGPVLHRATRLASVYQLLRGTLPFDIKKLHDEYGPVVRVAYNELSFIDPQAWKDIYGFAEKNQSNAAESYLPKYDKFYLTRGETPSLISEEPERHKLLRRHLSKSFGEQAIQQKEQLVTKYVDLLMEKLGKHSQKSAERDSPEPLNIANWFNWTSFDIIGEMTFGESFGCLDSSSYHPWISIIFKHLKVGGWIRAIKYLDLDRSTLPILRSTTGVRQRLFGLIQDKLDRRIELGADHQDLMEGLLKGREELGLTMEHLHSNASMLVLAGSETTAATLTGITYLLLSNPACLDKLRTEIFSAFKSEDEICFKTTKSLPYLQACIEEGLRRYPAVAIGFPRIIPSGGWSIANHYIPEGTIVSCWHYAMNHSASNWSDPYTYSPERWLEKDNSQDRLDALQPFHLGPGNCIGRNLAYTEMRFILSRLFFNFDLKLADSDDSSNPWIENQEVYTVREKKPLPVIIKPGKKNLVTKAPLDS